MKRVSADITRFAARFNREPNKKELMLIENIKNIYNIKNGSFATKMPNRYDNMLDQLSFGIDYDRIIETHKNLDALFKKRKSSKERFVYLFGTKEGEKRWDDVRKSYAISEKNFIRRYGEKEGKKRWKDYESKRGVSLNAYINRYGEKEGRKKHSEYWARTNFGSSLSKFISRHGEREGRKKYNEYCKQQGKNNTKEGYIERYGEKEGEVLYKDANLRKSKSQSKDNYIKYLRKDGYSDDEILAKIGKRWDNTSLSAFKERYGESGGFDYEEFKKRARIANPLCLEYYTTRGKTEKEAHEIIQNIQAERQSNASETRISKESMLFIENILSFFEFDIDVKFEYRIKLTHDEYLISNRRNLFYDFYLPEYGIIVEYHGEYYHDTNIDYANISSDICLDEHKKSFNMDVFKPWLARNRGFEIFVCRSWEYKKDFEQLVKIIREKNNDTRRNSRNR